MSTLQSILSSKLLLNKSSSSHRKVAFLLGKIGIDKFSFSGEGFGEEKRIAT